ncbi:MAG: DUF960 domain-containing protein [Cetobacterium sp.]
MFNNQRYLTKGINESIQLDIQIAIWDCIDKMEIAKDYLQVFDLIPKNGFTFVVHKQEEPEYSKEWILEIPIKESAKIFVIDDGEHSTMMLSEEY